MSKLFTKWFYLSLVLILFGLVFAQIKITDWDSTYIYLLNLLSQLLKDVGIAVFVSNLFSYILGTNEFISFIRQKLIEILISKEFIAKLSQEEQRKMLELVLKPTKQLSEMYSGITDYFKEHLEKSMHLFAKNYRGNLVIKARISVDAAKKRVKAQATMDYAIYSIDGSYDPIPFYSNNDLFEHIRTTITTPNSESKEFTNAEKIAPEDVNISNAFTGYKFEIPDEFKKHSQLNLHRNTIEYGDEHWTQFAYKALKPCHGFLIVVECDDDLTIKSFNVWGDINDKFQVQKDGETGIRIFCNQWVEAGFGVDVIASRRDFHTA